MKGFQSTQRIGTAATSTAVSTVRRGQHLLQHGQRALYNIVRWFGFWAAVVLPLVYLPVFAAEIGPAPGPVGLGLLGCHLLALVAGHNYNTQDQ